MQIISGIKIRGFRSIKEIDISDLSDFNCFAGLNNAGKSNILRAMNLFFNDQIETGQNLEFERDYYRPNLRKRMRTDRCIEISIEFNLPDVFKFRSGLEPVSRLFLGKKRFEITKKWIREKTATKRIISEYLLDNNKLTTDDKGKIDQFLQLITFRYVPNRVLPVEVIRNERQSLRDALVRRFSLRKKKEFSSDVFGDFKNASLSYLKPLVENIKGASPDIGEIRLSTPESWADIVIGLGYKLGYNGIELDDSVQGAGIQSHLMLETLYLIDNDFFQRFGWRQAAIWAIEEPESSLHASLETKVASYLRDKSKKQGGRLQVFATTHSERMLQYCDRVIYATKDGCDTSCELIVDKTEALEKASRAGVSHWVHPILYFPLNPILIVEGKYDADFWKEALLYFRLKRKLHVTCLKELDDRRTGGHQDTLNYVKNNTSAIKSRRTDSKVIVVLDWDASNKIESFKKLFSQNDPFDAIAWPTSCCNPNLNRTFRGIERHVSNRIILEAEKRGAPIYKSSGDIYSVNPEEYGKVKSTINVIVNEGLKYEDLIHAKDFIMQVIELAENQKPQLLISDSKI